MLESMDELGACTEVLHCLSCERRLQTLFVEPGLKFIIYFKCGPSALILLMRSFSGILMA